jgi:hypothetical protein
MDPQRKRDEVEDEIEPPPIFLDASEDIFDLPGHANSMGRKIGTSSSLASGSK